MAHNRDADTLFVVDEASMIGGRGPGVSSGRDGGFGDRDLLTDLFQHVFSAPRCKLLLIGDPAQLPPVGSDHSPALEVKDLADLGLLPGSIELTDVVRQAEDSGILVNATALRHTLASMPIEEHNADKPKGPPTIIPTFITGYPAVERIDGNYLQTALEQA